MWGDMEYSRLQDHMLSPPPRHHPPRPLSVPSILLAELVFHHLLLARDPREVQRNGRHQEGRTRDPVLEEEKLCDGPEEVRRVHRVANLLVDAFGYKRVVLFDLKPRREAPGKVCVRPPQKPEGLEEEGGAEGARDKARRGWQGVVRKVQPGRKKVEEGNDDHPQGRE